MVEVENSVKYTPKQTKPLEITLGDKIDKDSIMVWNNYTKILFRVIYFSVQERGCKRFTKWPTQRNKKVCLESKN